VLILIDNMALIRYTGAPPPVPTLEPTDPARTRLYGRRVTWGALAREAVRLRAGNPDQGVPGLSLRDVAARLGFKQPKSAADLLKLAAGWGIAADASRPSGIARPPAEYRRPADLKEFAAHPLIAKWLEGMGQRSHGGLPLKTMDSLLRSFMVVCNTTRTSPDQWVVGGRDDILEFGRKTMAAFMDHYKAGTAAINYPKNWSLDKADIPAVTHSYARGARNFLYTLGYSYPRGEASAMSASVVQFHGNFADVAMDEGEYAEGKAYIKSNWGQDSDVFRWFGVGIEGLPRARALHGMTTERELYKTKDGRTIYIMKAFESKTEHYRKGVWKKWITSPDVQASIDAVKGGHVITERRYDHATKQIYPKLKEVYKHLGLDKKHLVNPRDEESGYFMRHPSHALRHCGAQRWLRLTNWNVPFVASMGWKKPDELLESYGQQPAAMQLKLLEGLRFG